MKHNNISIFIPHIGCPNRCSFCNQQTISSTEKQPTVEQVRKLLQQASFEISAKGENQATEIAFFGGSFTAIDKTYMLRLLEAANEFVGKGLFSGIRISTRPDAISHEILKLLKLYNVTSIELGAQSMTDAVLEANNRGHTANDVIAASKLIQKYNFSLGLQMMIGLYADTICGAYKTADEIIKIKPDTVRIYPTVILNKTKLADLFLQGKYEVMELGEAVSLCADLLRSFEENQIKVIKLGLHSSADVEAQMLGGIYHPAFRELCEGELYYKKALCELEKLPKGNYFVEVSPRCISKMTGQNKLNLQRLAEKGYTIKVIPNDGLLLYQLICKANKK